MNAIGRLSPDEIRQEAEALGNVSLRSYVTPHDITNMALYLCSPFGATISGQALAVDGDAQSLA